MKKLNILLLSVLSLAMTVVSCSKDDKDESVTNIDLTVPVAKFVFDKWTETKDGVTSEERLAYKPECEGRRYLDFKADGELEEEYVGTVDEPCALVTYQGSYTQTGNIVNVVEDGGYKETYTVLAMTATKLTIRRAYHTDPTHLITYILIKQ